MTRSRGIHIPTLSLLLSLALLPALLLAHGAQRSPGYLVNLDAVPGCVSPSGFSVWSSDAGEGRHLKWGVRWDIGEDPCDSLAAHNASASRASAPQTMRFRTSQQGIDLILTTGATFIEYDFVVAPGADPTALKLQFRGADEILQSFNGDLLIRHGDQWFRHRKPFSYQRGPGGRTIEVASGYVRKDAVEFSFTLGDYDRSRELVIDPIIESATYYGSEGSESPYATTIDSTGKVLLTGTASLSNLPMQRPDRLYRWNTNFPTAPDFLTRMSADGKTVDYTARFELPLNSPGPRLLTVQSDDSPVLATSYTTSPSSLQNAPVLLGMGHEEPGTQTRILILGFDKEATITRFSALLSCRGSLYASVMRTDSSGRIWIAGSGKCTDLPPGAYRSPEATDAENVFIAVISSDGARLEHFAFLGGNAQDTLSAFTFDTNGQVLLGGGTLSSNFPTTSGAFRRTLSGASDGFVVRLNANLDTILDSTFLGGNSTDTVNGLQELPGGAIAFSAESKGTGFPTTPGVWNMAGGIDFAVSVSGRISRELTQIEMATYLPTKGSFALVTVDREGRHLLRAYSPLAPEVFDGGLFHPSPVSSLMEHSLIRLKADGSGIDWGTLLPSYSPVMAPWQTPDGESRLFLAVMHDLFTVSLPVTFSSGANPGHNPREIWIASIDLSNPTNCILNVTPTELNIPAAASTQRLGIDLPAGCPWIGSSQSGTSLFEWEGASSGFGSGEARLKLVANPYGRTELVFSPFINQQKVTFRQAPMGCGTYTVTPSTMQFPSEGGVRSADFQIAVGCEWTWFSAEPYVQPTLPTSWPPKLGFGSGNGAQAFTVSMPRNQFAARTATISMVLDRRYEDPPNPVPVTIQISQSAGPCTAVVQPTPLNAPAAGGDVSASLTTTGTDCSWQAGVPPIVSGPAFATLLSLPSGVGNATLNVSVAPNPSNTPRSTELLVAGLRVPLVQAAGECTVSFPATTVEAPAAGGQLDVRVDADGPACAWNLSLNATWFRVRPGSYMGGSILSLDVETNPTQDARQGTITILGRTITIRQAGTGSVLVVVNTDPGGIPVQINGVDYPNNIPGGIRLSLPQGASLRLSAPPSISVDQKTQRRFDRWNGRNTPVWVTTVPADQDPAYFTASYSEFVRLELIAVGNGSVASSPASEDGFYSRYSTVTLSAIPAPGHIFTRWTKWNTGEVVYTPKVELWMDAPYRYDAEFGPQPTSPPVPVTIQPALRRVIHAIGSMPGRLYQFGLRASDGIALFQEPKVECGNIPSPVHTSIYGLTSDKAIVYVTPFAPVADAMATGNYSCELRVPRGDGGAELRYPFIFELRPTGGDPEPQLQAMVNGASFQPMSFAPGSIVSLFGQNLTDDTESADRVPLPIRLAHVGAILRNGSGGMLELPLFYASPTQINFQLPEFVSGSDYQMSILHYGRRTTTSLQFSTGLGSPGIFTANSDGKGAPAGTWLRTSNANRVEGDLFECAQDGHSCIPKAIEWGNEGDDVFLILYVTGLAEGGTGSTFVTVDGVHVPVEYAGSQGQFIGLGQVNLRLPRELRGRGEKELLLRSGGIAANVVRVRF